MWLWSLLLVAVTAEGLRFLPSNYTDARGARMPSQRLSLYSDRRLHNLVSYRDRLSDKPYKVVCYFTNWAWYRQGAGKFLPEDIDPNLCTHVIYAFAVLDSEKLEIKVFDSWADIDNKFYEKIASLAQKGVKASVGIGGWTDSESDKYSRMINNPASRAHFVQQVTGFLEKYKFTGLDLDWEYPKCWQGTCSRGPASDKDAFAALVAELSAVFKPRNWHLSAAVSPNSAVIDEAYDVPKLSQHLDWVSLMGYDYHGSWDRKTGHLAPLHLHDGDDNPNFNVDSSISYLLNKGLAKEKLVVGMPTYGQSFTLANPSNNGLEAPTNGPGRAGPFTKAGGTLAFYEICQFVKKEQWETRRESDKSMGPYAIKGDQWVGYDDISDIKTKSELIKSKGLGGGMIWTLDFDDFKNTCGCGRFPLLTALSSTLNGGTAPPVNNCAQKTTSKRAKHKNNNKGKNKRARTKKTNKKQNKTKRKKTNRKQNKRKPKKTNKKSNKRNMDKKITKQKEKKLKRSNTKQNNRKLKKTSTN